MHGRQQPQALARFVTPFPAPGKTGQLMGQHQDSHRSMASQTVQKNLQAKRFDCVPSATDTLYCAWELFNQISLPNTRV